MMIIPGWICFVCGGCLGITVATVAMTIAMIADRKSMNRR